MNYDFLLGLGIGMVMTFFAMIWLMLPDVNEQRYYYHPTRREIDLAVREQGEVITHVSFDVKEIR